MTKQKIHEPDCDGAPWGNSNRCKCSFYKICPTCKYDGNGANSRTCAQCDTELRKPNRRKPQNQCNSCSQMFISKSMLIPIPISFDGDLIAVKDFVRVCDKCAPDWFERVQKLWAQFKKEKDC